MPRISELWAFIAEDAGPDDEGVVAEFRPETSAWVSLVGADRARMDSVRARAQDIANASGKRLKLVRFTVREELEVIVPKKTGN